MYPRDGIWWGYIPGRRSADGKLAPRFSLETRDEERGRERFADALQRAAADGATWNRPKGAEETLAMIVGAYLQAPHGWSKRSRRSCELRGAAFVVAMSKLGVQFPSQITSAKLDRWRQGRMHEASAATINRDEDVARRAIRWAYQRSMCTRVPVLAFQSRAKLREARRKAPPLIPSPGEVARVVAQLDDLARLCREAAAKESHPEPADPHSHYALAASAARGAALAISIPLACGIRIDELRHLTEDDIHAGSIHVVPEDGPADTAWQSKSYRERRIPVAASVARMALEFVRWRAQGSGGKGKAPGISDTWVADMIDFGRMALWANGSDAPHFRAHDLRRTFATECVRSGIPITTVREWMGHRDVQTTERYLGRYRDDALLVAPTPASLAVLADPSAGPKLAVVKR